MLRILIAILICNALNGIDSADAPCEDAAWCPSALVLQNCNTDYGQKTCPRTCKRCTPACEDTPWCQNTLVLQGCNTEYGGEACPRTCGRCLAPCQDMDAWCGNLLQWGHCSTDEGKTRCQKTCKTCKPSCDDAAWCKKPASGMGRAKKCYGQCPTTAGGTGLYGECQCQ